MTSKPKTLLIWPSLSGRLDAQVDMITEPLGLAYIAAVLEDNGYEVTILDALAEGNDQRDDLGGGLIRVGLTEAQVKDYISNRAPDVIGVSCMFSMYDSDYLRVAKLAKEVCPKAVVVYGGSHASVAPESVLRDRNVDLVVKGEGEITFLELVKCIDAGRDYADLVGTVMRNGDGSLRHNPPREPITDIDELPFPARHLLPMERYFAFQRKGRGMYRYYMRKPIANIITSRGCPYNCVFCASRTVWGRSWRGRSARSIVEELKFLTKEYGIKEFTPWDDNIAYDRKRLLEICDGIIEDGLDLKWATPNGIYLWKLDQEVLTRMKGSGYYRANFAIESGDLRTLKFIGKIADFEKVKSVLAICDRLGIWTASSFLIGFPDEDRKAIDRTLNASVELKVDFVAFYAVQPYPGTRLRTIMQSEGLLDTDSQEASWPTFSAYSTKHFTSDEVMALQQLAYKKFIKHRIMRALNPLNLGQIAFKINSPEKFCYFLRIIGNLILGVWMGRAAPPLLTERIVKGWERFTSRLPRKGQSLARRKQKQSS